jgi:hypothetical protein
MKFPVNYEFIVPDDHRKLVYYAQTNEHSVLAIETDNHRCIVLAETPEELLEVAALFGDSGYTPAVTTWHTLTLDWRMALYQNQIVLIKGGLTWQATGLTESPSKDSHLTCDPHTWVFVLKSNGKLLRRDDAIVVGSSPADLIIALDDSDKFDVNDLITGSSEIIALPILQIASHNAKVMYRGVVHDVSETLMTNTAFLLELMENKSVGGDPEESLIEKIEESSNEN